MQLKPDPTSPVSRVDKHKARLSDRGYTPRRTEADISARVESHRTRLAESLNPREVPRNVQYPTRAPYKAPMATIPVRTTTAQDVQDELKKQTMLHTQQIRTLEQQQKSTLEPASLLNLQTQKNDLLKQAPSADQVKKSLLIQQSEQRLFNNPNDEDAWMQYVGNKFNPSASNQFQTDPAYNKTIKAAYAPEIKKEGEKSYWSAIGQSLKDQVTLGTKATFNTLAGLNAGGLAAQQASGIPSRDRSLGDMIETAKASDAEQRAVYQKEAVSAFDQMAQNKQDAVGDNALKDFVYDLAGVVPDMVVTLGLTALTGGGGVASMGAKQIAKGLAKKEARAAALKAIGTKLVVGPEMVPMGTKIFAQAYQQNIASGMDEEQAFATSLVDAYGQSVLEGGGVNELFKAKGVKKLAQLGRSALGEGVEEVKQDVWSTAVHDTVGGVDTKLFSLGPNDQASYVNPLRQGRALALGTAAGGGAAAVQAPAAIKNIVDTKLKPQVSAPDIAAKTTEYEKQTEQYKADLEAHTQAKTAHEQHTKAVTQYEMDLAKYNKAKNIVMPEERGWADVSSKKVKAFATEHPELKPAIQAHAIEVLNDLKYTQKGERSPIIDEEGYIAGYTGNKRTTSPTVEKILTATKTAPSYAAVTKALNDIIAGNSGADRALAKRIELILDDNLTNGYTSFDGAKIEENLSYKVMKNEIRPGYFGETFEAPKAPTPPAAIPPEPVAPTIDLSPTVDTSKMAPAVLNRLQADMASIGDQAQQVVELAAQGRTRSEIVETLGVAPKAVRAVMTLKGIPDVKSVEFARWRAAQNYGKATVEKTEAEVEQVITPEEAQARVDNIGVLAKTSAKAVQDLERGEVYVQRLGKRLGVDVVFYEGGKDTARGMFSAKESRTIFIDRESAKDGKVTMDILGHEFLHYVNQNHADLYKALREVVGDTMTTEKVAKQLEKYKLDPEYQGRLANDKELLIEEMLAEEAGSLFTDKEFWANVAAKDENVAQKLIKLIGDFIDRILTGSKKVSGNLDVMTELQIKDFQKRFEAATASLVQQKKALQAASKAAAETKQATKKYTNPVETEAFKTWFGASKVVDEQGNPKKLYTGHGNSAMYGAKFNPKLATAGAFYTTDNPEIASSYANQKMGQMKKYEDGSQYKVGESLKDKISDVRLTKEQRDKAVALLNDEYGYDIEAYFKDNERYGDVRRGKARGGTYNLGTYYSFLEQMGDTIAYAKEGNEPFFLRQRKNGFEDLMDTLGIDWSSYEWNQPGVMAVYLRVENPLDTNAEFPADLMAALEAAAKKERAQDWQHDAHWTKDYSLKAWVADINRDYEEGGVHGWATQIPAKAAKIIKAHGYDGIKDVGGKNGGTGHEVWMAFEPNQIKSATGNKGTFSTKNNDMRLSVKMENEVFYTNHDVEVIKNPTDDQFIGIMQEFKKQFPEAAKMGEPAIRKTYDLEDNVYIWKSSDSVHAYVEPFINKKYGTLTNQGKLFPVRDLLQKNLGVNDKEALIGEQALQELEAKFSSKAPTKIRTIARDFTEKLVNTGYVDFVGQTINDVDELAVMAQILRNPKFETLRYFFVDKNKQIVHHTGVSANVPGMTPAFEGYDASSRNVWLNQMVSTAKRQGATGFFMMHNHPSGNPVPSKEDYAVSAALRNTLWDMKFHGHLIINSSKYAFFDGAGADNKEHEIFDLLMQDKLLVPDKPHALLGTQVSGPADMSLLAEKMKAKEGYTTIMYMSPANKLRGAQEVPTHLVDTIPNLQDFLKANALGFGGAHAVVLAENTKTFVAAKQLIEDSYVFEAIDMTNPWGTSARAAGAMYDPNKWMGSEPLGTKAWEPDAKYSTRMATIEEAFKDSKIRNADGSLRRVQHGTNSEFTQFSASTFGKNTGTSGFYGDGFYFTDNPYIPGAYGRNIMDVYLNITKPFILDRNTSVNQVAKLAGVTPITSNLIYNDNLSDTIMQDSAKFTQSLKKLGFDGVVLKDIFGDGGMPEIVAFYPEQIKSPDGDGVVDLENPDIRYSLGYHAGDLGKSEYLGSQYGSNRGTGHFGTGTYFVGNKKDIAIGGYQNRPQHEVEFRGYNLYKPETSIKGRDLHRALKFLNTYYEASQETLLPDRVFREMQYMETDELVAALDGYGKLDHEQFEDWFGIPVEDLNEDNTTREIVQYLEDRVRDIQQGNDFVETAQDEMAFFAKQAPRLFGLSERAALQYAKDVYDEIKSQANGKPIYYNEALRRSDSASTRFMKALGYEGVDVRGLQGLDNTEYGSVIYNLQPEEPKFSIRKSDPPKKTVKAYKLMRTDSRYPGKLFPLFVSANEETPIGVWLDADEGAMKLDEKTGNKKVVSKLGPLAYRPGWHLGDIPLATHIGKKGPSGNIEFMDDSHVWCEAEVAADINYQEEARANGVNPKTGKFNAARGDLKKLPVDGFYRYKTNPNMTGNWIITGAIKINRVLTDEEAAKIVKAAGHTPLPRYSERQSTKMDEGIEISMKEVKEPLDAKGWFKRLYQRVVDRALPIELTDETAGRLAANTSLVSGTLEHIMLRALVDSGGNVVGKSWKATAKPFHDNVDFWLYMANRHNVDRAREGKPVIPSRTQAESYMYYKSKEKEHPEYKTWGDDVTAWIDQFMKVWGIDTGVIDSVTYDLWRAMYPSYFPTYREFSDLEKMNGTGGGGKRFVDLPSPVKRATGSERNITNPVGNVMMMANKIVRTARYNAVGQALLDTVRSDPEGSAKFAEEIPANIGMFQSRKLDNVVSVFEEGHAAYLQINDKALLESLEGLPKVINNAQTVRKITNVYKGLITSYNPLFAIRNIFRDIPTAYVYGSQDNPLFFMGNLVKAGYQLTTHTGGAERYRAMGGAGSGQFSADEAAKYAALLQPSSAAILKVPLKAIQFFNELTEQAPRVSEFNHVLKKTGDVQKALHAAQSVTVNFARGGDVTKRVEPFVPYLNASVQGIDTFFRKMIFDAGKNPSVVLKRWVKAGIAVTAPQIVSYLVSTFDDEDRKAYEQLDQRTKDTAYVFPKGDGTFWKIPKSRELGVLFGTLFERSIVGSFEGITGAVATNFLPVDPFQNNIASAFVYNLPMNEDFAGRKIVPEYMLNDKRSKALQYDDNTSEISKAIGARTNLSPKQIDYIVRSYTGVIGQFLIPATTARSGAGSAVERMTTGAFTADPAFSSQSMTNFYNRLDELGQIRTDKNIQESVPSKVVTSEERLYNLMNKVSANITKTTKYVNANLKTDDPRVRQLRVTVNKYTGRAAKAEKPADVIKILAEMNAELYKNGVR